VLVLLVLRPEFVYLMLTALSFLVSVMLLYLLVLLVLLLES
jgi:hypothetical protein